MLASSSASPSHRLELPFTFDSPAFVPGAALEAAPAWVTLPLRDVDLVPERCGVYAIRVDGTVVYIGHSKNLRSRLRGHRSSNRKLRKIPIDSVSAVFKECSDHSRQEARLIREVRPAWNGNLPTGQVFRSRYKAEKSIKILATRKVERAAYRLTHKEQKAAYRLTHKEEIAAYNRAYRITHKEQRNAYNRTYSLTRKAKKAASNATRKAEIAARDHAYYLSHKEHIAVRSRAYHATHKEQKAASNRARRARRKLAVLPILTPAQQGEVAA